MLVVEDGAEQEATAKFYSVGNDIERVMDHLPKVVLWHDKLQSARLE